MDDETRERLVNGSVWLRGLHMVIFVIAYNIAELIIVALALFQFLAVLITGRANEALLRLGKNLSVYAEDIFEFLTFNSEIRPFPFEPWPDEPRGGDAWVDEEPGTGTSASTVKTAEVVAESAPAETGEGEADATGTRSEKPEAPLLDDEIKKDS